MPSNQSFVATANELLRSMHKSDTADAALQLAQLIVSQLGHSVQKPLEEIFESAIELPNAERYDGWFQPHPIFKSDRACFEIAETPLLQAKFYWLKKRSRQIIAGGVHFSPNYEDEDYTHNERYKVGVDFFLSPNGKSLQVVLSNRGNLRIVELSNGLNNTQIDIFSKWIDAGKLPNQEALHTTIWESFKLKSVNQKFYDGVANSFNEILQHLKHIGKEEEEAKLFSSRLLGRLLFVWFLRKKGIIDESIGYFAANGQDATTYYKQSLERLFFLTLNTPIDDRDELTKQHQKQLFPELEINTQPSLFKTDQKTPYLNGGLFEPHENDWYKDSSLTLPEGFFVNLYAHFDEFNFTTDESTPEYEQIAIDPEMLGRVFESLLATQVDETGEQATKAKGAFYTPREIVSYMCKESLRSYLYCQIDDNDEAKESVDNLLDITDSDWAKSKSNNLRDKIKSYRAQIITALDNVTILDPACGSGAFPIGILQLMFKTYERLETRFDPYKTKLSIIENNIYGADIEPMAVEIARLRAWLSLIVDEEEASSVDPLPNLDFKFVCANSLLPLDKEMGLFSDQNLHSKLKDIRLKYFNARKKHTKKALQDEYYKLTSSEQTTLITDDRRTFQLKSFNPFTNSHPAEFFDTDHMFGVTDGFEIVIGNPPYGAKTPTSHKPIFKKYYKSAQTITGVQKGSLDTFTLFTENGYNFLKIKGNLSYIVPLTITSGDSMTGLHNLLLQNCVDVKISSYCDRPIQIFKNAHKKLSIINFVKTNTPVKNILMTKMNRVHNETSLQSLVNNLSFIDVSDLRFLSGRLPKISYDIEKNILHKIFNNDNPRIKDILKHKGDKIYYRSAGGMYFNVITNYSNNLSSEKSLTLDNLLANPVCAILSSTIFWWYQQVFTDCLNLKASEIESFPLPLSIRTDTELLEKLDILFKKFAIDIEKNVVIRETSAYKNVSSFKEYKIRKSFTIIDEIDKLVNEFYGLNEDESNFIRQYERTFRNDDEVAS